jgi:serine/threonine protein kinase
MAGLHGRTLAHVAPVTLHRVVIERDKDGNEKKVKYFCTLPRYPGTLGAVATASSRSLRRLWEHISEGLGEIHALGFAHMDVKPDNIAIDASGAYFLIDLDSVARFDTCPRSSTELYLPYGMRKGNIVASAAVDWWMLAATFGDLLMPRGNR